MKKILLLGSNGYIGNRLYRELSMLEFYNENYDITCVVSLNLNLNTLSNFLVDIEKL